MNNVIEVENLSKNYGSIKAVNGISFYVEQGSRFAFLGTNGAGKSTTIDILCTLLKPDGGSAVINGCEIGKHDDEIRKNIGVVFQQSLLDPLLTVNENLIHRAKIYGMNGTQAKNAAANALKSVSAGEIANRRYGKLSGGQRRRADIARALLNTPKILFLDEPTTGLDPKSRLDVWQTVSELQKNSGMTVFLTTHYMEEAADTDYIVIMEKGEIAAKGTPEELKSKYSSDLIRLMPKDFQTVCDILRAEGFKYEIKNDTVSFNISDSIDALPVLNKLSDFIATFEAVHGTMDDVFLNVTGREIDV